MSPDVGKPRQLKLFGGQLVAVDENQTSRVERHRPSPPGATRTASPVPNGPSQGAADASERAPSAGNGLPDDLECTGCGLAFVNTAAFDLHRPNGQCLRPTDVGLTVAPRAKLTWSVPVRVPTAVDERHAMAGGGPRDRPAPS